MDTIPLMRGQHRAVEVALDRMETALKAGCCDLAAFAEARRLALAHYAAEELLLFPALREPFPEVVRKMERQHEEAREIGAVCESLFADGDPRDLIAVARRFHALTQHNIIEEERDLFTWAEGL